MRESTSGENSSTSLRIAVVGAGWMGGSVGKAWVRAGHEVMFSSRHPERLGKNFGHLGKNAKVGSVGDALLFADIVLLTLPYASLPALAGEFGSLFAGKLVLDAANPSSDLTSQFAADAFARGVGVTTQQLFPGAVVVRAFSCVDAMEVDSSSHRASQRLAVPVAGDDSTAVARAEHLVRDAGCEPLVVGGLAAASRFERGTQAFRANTTLARLKSLLKIA
ncbi:NAD(P)-binding domain-containing protein [Caballeronia sp. GAWG2-1]|uniref:NADPH-dependent F420 reductase n=1 Tax=Caballeronia sp. GAWG2-1 TaxID=2921744 RepID=UPI002028B1BF|nr:NAD(P)-binding domain-containing protein [Caballeronia sp. GAWG2-1]